MTDSSTQTAALPGPLADLGDDLVAAATRQAEATGNSARHRRWTPMLVAAAVVAVVAIGGIAVAVDDRPVAADVHVERNGNRVTVSIENDVSVEDIRDALARAGVDVRVEPQTTGPSLQNRFVGSSAPADAELQGGGEAELTATFTEGSKVTLRLGVAGDSGEPYDVATVATAKGEPLEGLDLIGRTVADSRKDIARAAPDATVQYRGPDGQPTERPAKSAVIVGAQMFSDDLIAIFLR